MSNVPETRICLKNLLVFVVLTSGIRINECSSGCILQIQELRDRLIVRIFLFIIPSLKGPVVLGHGSSTVSVWTINVCKPVRYKTQKYIITFQKQNQLEGHTRKTRDTRKQLAVSYRTVRASRLNPRAIPRHAPSTQARRNARSDPPPPACRGAVRAWT